MTNQNQITTVSEAFCGSHHGMQCDGSVLFQQCPLQRPPPSYQVEPALRLSALSALLSASLDRSEGRAQADVPRRAVAFSTAQIKVR